MVYSQGKLPDFFREQMQQIEPGDEGTISMDQDHQWSIRGRSLQRKWRPININIRHL